MKILNESSKELERDIVNKDYKSIKNKLDIISRFLKFFDEKKQLVYMERIRKRIECSKVNIFRLIKREFCEIFESWTNEGKIDKKGKLVIEIIKVLSDEIFLRDLKLEITKKFVFKQLDKYNFLFGRIGQRGLGKFDKRFKWIRDFIKKNKPFFDMFPNNWYFIQESITEFCIRTNPILKKLLDNFNDSIDVLTDVILMTRRFEKEMNRKYRLIIKSELDSMLKEIDNKLTINENNDQEKIKSGEDVNIKWKLKKEKETLLKKQKKLREIQKRQIQPERNYKFRGQMSQIFNSYMNIYVKNYREFSESNIKHILSSEVYDPSLKHCGSSIYDLFEKMFTKLKQITCGKTLYDVYNYCWIIGINSILNYFTKRVPVRSKKIKLKDNSENVCIQILRIIDYLRIKLEEFEVNLKKDISEGYKSKISFKVQQEKIHNLSETLLGFLSKGEMLSIRKSMKSISGFDWENVENVHEESEVIKVIKNKIIGYSQNLFGFVSVHCSKLFIKVTRDLFIKEYFRTILNCSGIKGHGISQFKIDIKSLKDLFKYLIQKHKNGKNEEIECVGWEKVDVVFKILLLPDLEKEKAVSLYNDVFGQEGKLEEFRKIISLRGWKVNGGKINILKRLKRVVSSKKK